VPSAVPVALPNEPIRRHYHPRPYATLVVEGAYEEAGDQGRLKVEPGDILLHPAFSAHQDVVHRSGTRVLDIPLPLDGRAWPALGRVADVDLLMRAAGTDLLAAAQLLIESFEALGEDHCIDPADRLAAAITDDPSVGIAEWARAHAYGREWLSRRFRRLYGIDAAVFRLEARTRQAWRQVVGTSLPLAAIAADAGFADQAHMTRAIGALTGRPPGAWRRPGPVTSVQEGDVPVA
jgi:AraC-like DNA-binding protein